MAHVASRLAVNTMLRAQFDETITLCERALGIAEQFDLEDIRSHVLNTRGVVRVTNRGDLGGLADMEASLEIADRIGFVDGIIRGCKNLGSTLAELGDSFERANWSSAEPTWRGASGSTTSWCGSRPSSGYSRF